MSGADLRAQEAAVARLVQGPERPQTSLPLPPFHTTVLPDGSPWALFHRLGTGYLLRFPGMADFEISCDGREVKCWPVPGTPESSVQHLYLNQALPLALSRQGRLVLHASAVEASGSAAAFLGPSGRGKSTLAASFATSGSRFLTDDGLQIVMAGGQPQVVPSHPSIRLWDDSAQALLDATAPVGPSVHYTRKTRFLAGDGLAFCDQPRPLRRTYLLGPGITAQVSIRPCQASDAFMGMVRNSFLLDIGEPQMLARHFDDIAGLANLPLHYHLDFPREHARLPEVRAAVLRHLADPEDLP